MLGLGVMPGHVAGFMFVELGYRICEVLSASRRVLLMDISITPHTKIERIRGGGNAGWVGWIQQRTNNQLEVDMVVSCVVGNA